MKLKKLFWSKTLEVHHTASHRSTLLSPSPTPLPLPALKVKQSSLKHDWQLPIVHPELHTALLAIISAVSGKAETWAVSIPASPFPSVSTYMTLPFIDKDDAKAKRTAQDKTSSCILSLQNIFPVAP